MKHRSATDSLRPGQLDRMISKIKDTKLDRPKGDGMEPYWEPTEEQKKYLNLIQSMTMDSVLGRGVDSIHTYIANLENIIKLIPKSSN